MAEVTASLSHELNQPLGAILNNAEAARRLLNTKPLDVEDLKDAVEGIIRDVGRATDIVRHTREAFHPVIEVKARSISESCFSMSGACSETTRRLGASLCA